MLVEAPNWVLDDAITAFVLFLGGSGMVHCTLYMYYHNTVQWLLYPNGVSMSPFKMHFSLGIGSEAKYFDV